MRMRRAARAMAGHALSRLTPRTAIALGFSESARTLQQRLAATGDAAFLVARDPMSRAGFSADSGVALGVRQQLGPIAADLDRRAGPRRCCRGCGAASPIRATAFRPDRRPRLRAVESLARRLAAERGGDGARRPLRDGGGRRAQPLRRCRRALRAGRRLGRRRSYRRGSDRRWRRAAPGRGRPPLDRRLGGGS